MIPFLTFPFQDEAVLEVNDAIEKGRDLVIYKSRDLGVSWLCLGVFEWRWHFISDQSFLCIARDKDEVDAPAYPDSLFQKIDKIHQWTPAWMMPKGWNAHKHRLRFTFGNPENGSTINGEATVAAAGVGGRKTAILIDEFSRIEQGAEMDFGTADASPCRIFNFTAYGTGNAAYEMLKNKFKKKLMLHWTMDPRKNAKLYRWNGELQRYDYFRHAHGQGEPAGYCGDKPVNLVRCEHPHQYGPEDYDRTNFTEENGYPDGRPFEPIPDGVLRSPVYDAEDRRRSNRRYMAINWDIDFEGSDNKFFDTKMLLDYNRDLCTPPAWEGELDVDPVSGEALALRERPGGPLRLWVDDPTQLPTADRGYAAGADISRGQGATNSCLALADIDTGVKVAEYVTPYENVELFAAKCAALGKLFRSHGGTPAFLAWERIGPGEPFGNTLFDLGYNNVYYDGQEANREIKPGMKPGWMPNPKSIRKLLDEYEVALRTRRYINRSTPAVEECDRFVKDSTGKVVYQSSAGHRAASASADETGAREDHGDRVVADALCVRAIRAMGGGTTQALQRAKEPDPEETPGTLAWRRLLRQQKNRDAVEAWA